MFDLKTLETLPVLSLPGTDPTQLTGLSQTQMFLNQYFTELQMFWWVFFGVAFLFVIYKAVKAPVLAPLPAPKPKGEKPAWRERYAKLFSLHEIENEPALRLMGGAVLLGFLINFYFLVQDTSATVQGVESGINVCWPFFPGCSKFIFLEAYPFSHMQRMVYACLFFVILITARKLLEKDYVATHVGILIIFLWHLYISLMSYSQYMHAGAYTYYVLSFGFIYLFTSHKRFFLSLAFIFFYFLSVPTKLSDTWILGTYFSAEQAAAPLFSNELIPFATNWVILIEILVPWYLISRHKWPQTAAFYIYSTFHFYATFIVMYHYSIIAIPAFVILFGPLYKPFNGIPKDVKSYIGWSFIGLLCIIQAVPHMISNDRWMTLQGAFYGMYMIEANHQCQITISDHNGPVQKMHNAKPSYRCDPYRYVKIAQQSLCKKNPHMTYSIEFLHSVNGGPFYKIVDEENLCELTYKPFSHNEWIQTRETAPAVFRPTKN